MFASKPTMRRMAQEIWGVRMMAVFVAPGAAGGNPVTLVMEAAVCPNRAWKPTTVSMR
jgi:hypothetical protein